MNRTVIIDCDDQGNYSVGVEPHEPAAESASEVGGGEGGSQDQGEGQIDMQPAKSLDDALNMARSLFSQDQGGDGAATEAAYQGGFNKVAGGGMPGGMGGGGGMM